MRHTVDRILKALRDENACGIASAGLNDRDGQPARRHVQAADTVTVPRLRKPREAQCHNDIRVCGDVRGRRRCPPFATVGGLLVRAVRCVAWVSTLDGTKSPQSPTISMYMVCRYPS